MDERRFDLVVANPPYIAAADPHLAQGDLRFEPRHALTPGDDGLGALHAIILQAVRALRPGGWLLLEHGHDQADAVRAALAARGYSDVFTERDLAGLERISGARRPRRARTRRSA
jgi:release factor glutamine methyltransferase